MSLVLKQLSPDDGEDIYAMLQAPSTMTLPGRARPRGRIWQIYFGRRGCLELSRGILHGQKSDGWEGKLCFYCPPHKP